MFYTSILLYSTVHIFFLDYTEEVSAWLELPSVRAFRHDERCVCERSQGWFGNGAGTR